VRETEYTSWITLIRTGSFSRILSIPSFQRVFSQKKAFLLLINKFPLAFMWTWLSSVLNQRNPVQNLPFYLSQIVSNIILQYMTRGVRGSAVDWNTGLKAERFRFRFPMSYLGFYTDLILPSALWALESTRSLTKNEHQGYLLRGKGEGCLGPTTLLPSCANCLAIWQPPTPGTLEASPGLYRDCFTLSTFTALWFYMNVT
jgi:hypothetical protein